MKKKEREFSFYWEHPVPGKKASAVSVARSIPISISETASDVIVRAELPQFRKSEISLNVTERTLEIAAAKQSRTMEKGRDFFFEEKTSGSVRRAFTLPHLIDPDRAKATLSIGVLMVTLPKAGETKQKRRNVDID